MIRRHQQTQRPGAVIVFVAICSIIIFGLLALAIDIGMMAVARSQCQNAADSAACAGARTINGDDSNNYNLDSMPVKAFAAATSNYVLGQQITGTAPTTATSGYIYANGQVKVEVGTYAYVYNDSNPAAEGFQMQFPRSVTTEPYTAIRATVSGSGNYAFGRLFGQTSFNTSTLAVSAHRPRDVVIILDLSGSMRFQSLPGINVDSSGNANPSSNSAPRNKSMNPDTDYPKFGHYSDTTTAALYGNSTVSTGAENVDPANISVSSNSGPPIALDFYQNATGVLQSSANYAFTAASSTYATTPGGLNYLKITKNTGATYAKTVTDIVGANVDDQLAFENFGYDTYTTVGSAPTAATAWTITTADYTQGPSYWGKTFFIWPPDPRSATSPAINSALYNNNAPDWRQRFFIQGTSGSSWVGVNDTSYLFNTGGSPATNSTPTPTPIKNMPNSSGYRINYEAILHWLRNENPKPFPTILRAGKIKYYDDIPDPSSSTYSGLNNRWWTTATLTNTNERFWKEYIDFVIGVQGTGAGTYTNVTKDPNDNALSNVPLSAMIGNGDYMLWGTYNALSPFTPTVQVLKRTVSGSTVSANATGTTSAAGAQGATTINVTGLPQTNSSSSGPFPNAYNSSSNGISTASSGSSPSYIRFAGHRSVYKITSATTSGSGQTVSITSLTFTNARPSNTYTGLLAAVANGEAFTIYSSIPQFIDYNDNPYRPRHQFWFGPMTMIDFLGNYNTTRFWWPGNVHEAQAWACKVGIQTAIDDIKKNHPNDFIGMTFFSSPYGWAQSGHTSKNSGHHNRPIVNLGRNYQQLKDSLWFPPSTVTGGVTEITPYDADMDNVPRANGGTAPQMGFMLAYNMLSSSVTNLRTYSSPQSSYYGNAGGLGRKGANRLVIFETDGAPNTQAYAALSGSGTDAYYPIRLKYPDTISNTSNEFPNNYSYSISEVYPVVAQIVANTSSNGYSTSRKPAVVYPLGYGSMYDPANSSTTQTNALNFMQTVGYNGGTSSDTTGSNFPDWQRIYGTNAQRITRMQTAFTTIMQNGVQISLLQ